MILTVSSDYFFYSVNQLIFVMMKCCVFFAVQTEFLNTIQTSFGFKGLMYMKIIMRCHDGKCMG
jgi:hypothetical protein